MILNYLQFKNEYIINKKVKIIKVYRIRLNYQIMYSFFLFLYDFRFNNTFQIIIIFGDNIIAMSFPFIF